MGWSNSLCRRLGNTYITKRLDHLLIKEYCKVRHKRCQIWSSYGLWPPTLVGSDLFKTNYSKHHDLYTSLLLKQVFCKFVLKRDIINCKVSLSVQKLTTHIKSVHKNKKYNLLILQIVESTTTQHTVRVYHSHQRPLL